jgi:hypothetical protein
LHRLRLRCREWEIVEEAAAVIHIGSAEPFGYDSDDYLGRGQLAALHGCLRLQPQVCATVHMIAQQVTGGDVDQTIRAYDPVTQCAFARERGAGDKHDSLSTACDDGAVFLQQLQLHFAAIPTQPVHMF